MGEETRRAAQCRKIRATGHRRCKLSLSGVIIFSSSCERSARETGHNLIPPFIYYYITTEFHYSFLGEETQKAITRIKGFGSR